MLSSHLGRCVVLAGLLCLGLAGLALAADPVVTLKSSGKTFQANGASGSIGFTVTGTPRAAVTVGATTADGSWLTIKAGSQSQTFTLNSKGKAKGSIKYTVADYTGSASTPRQGTILVGGSPFTVTQNGVPCSITLNPMASSVAGAGGSRSFSVTAPQGCGWTASADAPWIGIFDSATGSGSATVAFTVTPNPGNKRDGTITVTPAFGSQGKKTHAVHQAKGDTVLPVAAAYVVFAWNDLGMHCLNPTYDDAVILPPYNTVWAQVIRKGNPPQIVTTGVTLDYRLLNNTVSYGKRSYGQFWDYMQDLFGVTLPHNLGLNLEDPLVNNGLSGTMLAKGDHFQVNGIPVTPVLDDGTWTPYQVVEVTVRDQATAAVLAQTRATVPVSDEIRCDGCHGNEVAPILAVHDTLSGTTLQSQRPVLCASCHPSPALGSAGAPGRKYLSQSIHGFHGTLPLASQPACYDCHPGQSSKCNRSLRHTAPDGNCTTCHGTLAQVASSIAAGRVPWVSEPACATCHGGTTIPEVTTGATLYRNAIGHGGMRCSACHGSPHAMVPSSEPTDNYQALAYQGRAVTIGSCAACHENSKGEELEDFAEEHGGSSPRHRNACHICHTAVPFAPTLWPHGFKWIAR